MVIGMIERRTGLNRRCISAGSLSLALVLGVSACSGTDDAATDDQSARTAVGSAVTASLLDSPREQAVPAGEPIDIVNLGHNLGTLTAPVQIIEFSDFGCGYCRKFHVETLPKLVADYVDQGSVVWKYVPFELGMFANGRASAVAGQCAAEQDAFFAMGDLLFSRQSDWKKESEPRPVFVRLAGELGLDLGAYESCLDSEEVLAVIDANTRVARQVGIRSTPTFFVNGFPLQGALPEDVFRDMIDGVIEEVAKGAGEQPGAP